MGLLLGGILGGGGGGGPPAGGYTVIGEILSFAVPDGSALSNAQRTLVWNSRPSAGQLLVGVAATHPERTGTVFLRQPNFLPWSSAGGTTIAGNANGITLGIFPRIATGDANDDCLMNGVVGPQALTIFAVGGNAYPTQSTQIVAASNTLKTVNDVGAHREGVIAAGFLFTLRVAATMKANNANPTTVMPSVDAAMDFTVGGGDLNTGAYASGDSFCMAVATKIVATVTDTPDGDFGITTADAADSFAIAVNWKSGDS